MNRTRSHEIFTRAQALMPGGVNSPARAFGAVGGEPPVIARGLGAYLWDVDDNRYIDYIGSWGPMILGHAHPAVTAALDERIDCAVPFNFGGPQPETRYPLPEDAETWFNYAGGGSWESMSWAESAP